MITLRHCGRALFSIGPKKGLETGALERRAAGGVVSADACLVGPRLPRYLPTMTSAFPLHRYTFEDYVELEEASPIKHEFLEGEIVAMAGGTPEHAAMAAYIIRALGNQLESGPCRVFSSDLGVRVLETGLSTYPDASVVCGPTERDPKKPTSITNPRVLVEVTSNSTEHYDRGQKLEHYKQVPSLEAVVIVSHRESLIEVWALESGAWRRSEYRTGSAAIIAPVNCVLDVASVYAAAVEPSRGI